MAESLFIVGATGRVGKELVSQIFDKGDNNIALHQNPTSIVGVASSKSFLYDSGGLSESDIRSFSAKRKLGTKYNKLTDLLEPLKGSKDSVSIVDVTAEAERMLELHKKVIFETKHKIVTANKIPLAISDYVTFERLVSEISRYGYRCSVMAGAEAVDKIRDLRDIGDNPTEITGVFSGTLGYIATELEKGRKFSEIVKEAMENGYTEPNPVIDLSGSDVASKILILARTAGAHIGLSDIKLSPFIPDEYLNAVNVGGFLKGLSNADIKLASMMENAQRNRSTLRYIARYVNHGRPRISVNLEEVSLDNPLGQLKGAVNKIIIKTKTYGDRYYSVEAPGAGADITAQNIRRDLLYQLDNRTMSNS